MSEGDLEPVDWPSESRRLAQAAKDVLAFGANEVERMGRQGDLDGLNAVLSGLRLLRARMELAMD